MLVPNNQRYTQTQLAKNNIHPLITWSLSVGGREHISLLTYRLSLKILKREAGDTDQEGKEGSSREAGVRKGIQFQQAYHIFLAF